jgi:Domain of unknown function (DUF5710)
MSSETNKKFYLDCPFSDKEEVKALGAKWDDTVKHWFVPLSLYSSLPKFNHWIPLNSRLYLMCPFDEKDEAKAAGAKWDSEIMAWYVQGPFTSGKLKKFSKWLTGRHSTPDRIKSSSPRKKQAKVSLRGNASDAATLKVSDSMTVSQLQEECKIRGIKGLSGKNKDWFLEQLGVGSTWQAMGMKIASAKSLATTHLVDCGDGTKQKAKAKPKNEVKKKPPGKSTEKPPAKTKAPAASPAKKSKSLDVSKLPKVTSDLTISQLTHELLHRQPQSKGTSSKPKSWFLELLGEHSIWSTSPEATQHDLSALPVVSSKSTIAQPTHEVMSRFPQPPKGMSTKTKTDLLKMLGMGSVLTTGALEKQDATKAKHSSPKRKAPSSAKAKDSANKKRPPKPDYAKSALVSTSITSWPQSGYTVPAQSSLSSLSAQANEERVLIHEDFNRKRPMPLLPYDIEKEEGNLVSTSEASIPCIAVYPSKKARRSVVPPKAVSSSGIKCARRSEVPLKAVSSSGIKWARRSVVPLKVVSSSGINSGSLTTAARRGPLPFTTIEQDAPKQKAFAGVRKSANVPTPDNNRPVVTANMTLAQLKTELQARNPDVKGLSGKNKGWFLAELGSGTFVQRHYDEKQTAILSRSDVTTENRAAQTGKNKCSHNRCSHLDAQSVGTPNNDMFRSVFISRAESIARGFHNEDVDEDGSRKFTSCIRKPLPESTNEKVKLAYTIWTSMGFDPCNRYAYNGAPAKEFNSSFATLEQANQRAEYVFYYDNPWGLSFTEMSADSDIVSSHGFRCLSWQPDDDRRWTVSVITSEGFSYINL